MSLLASIRSRPESPAFAGWGFLQQNAANALLLEAVQTGDISRAHLCLTAGAASASSHDPGTPAPLHVAARRGEVRLVHLLLEHGASIEEKQSSGAGGGTVLHAAMECAEEGAAMEICEILIRAGVEVNELNELRQTALHIAARRGKVGLAALLLRNGVDPNTRDSMGRTARHWANVHHGPSSNIAGILPPVNNVSETLLVLRTGRAEQAGRWIYHPPPKKKKTKKKTKKSRK